MILPRGKCSAELATGKPNIKLFSRIAACVLSEQPEYYTQLARYRTSKNVLDWRSRSVESLFIPVTWVFLISFYRISM